MSFIAMNRFKINRGREADFEDIWRNRERNLHEMKGFVEFRLLKGAENEDYTLYSSHVIWDSKEDFEAWTKSQQFRDSHKNAGQGRSSGIMAGHPNFEGFETILQENG